MKRVVLAVVIIALALPSICLAQSAVYTRDPVTGTIYEHRFDDRTYYPPAYRPDYRESQEINREISRGGQPVQNWDYLETQRKILELQKMRQDLNKGR